MKTAGMLPDCCAKKVLKKKKKPRKKEGESRGLVKREDEVTTSPLSLSLSPCLSLSPFLSVRAQQSGEGAVKPGCQNFPSEPEQKMCSDKRRGVMESAGETSVRPLQSQLILNEVISPAETHSHPHCLYLPLHRNRFSPEVFCSVPVQKLPKKKFCVGSRILKKKIQGGLLKS